MIFTGDIHGDHTVFYERCFGSYDTERKNKYLLVAGDFGFVYRTAQDGLKYRYEREYLDFIAGLPYTVLFVDGNHENFDRLNSEFPTVTLLGGRAHKIRDNIFHLMRGEIYTIEEKRVFAMGGAASHDKEMRTEGRSWWRQEMLSQQEYERALENLSKCGNRVDIIITHTAPEQIIRAMGKVPYPDEAPMNRFLSEVADRVEFDKWFFGHWHTDKWVCGRFRAIYSDVCCV